MQQGRAFPLLAAYWESHSTSARWLEPLSILCIACLDKLSLFIFKTFHSRGLAQNGEPLLSIISRGPFARKHMLHEAATITAYVNRGSRPLCCSKAHWIIYPPSVSCWPLFCIYYLDQWFYLFFHAALQVWEMLSRTFSFFQTLWKTDFAYPFEKELSSCFSEC